ncbi:hypothetical protein AB836_00710 [Rickettsiales bacterium (ex Bugula neritina AB1)]|nr:hypothetical protein AB836_00710 [Rickettsiales bacterium (ex Bugula neritina AB1)]
MNIKNILLTTITFFTVNCMQDTEFIQSTEEQKQEIKNIIINALAVYFKEEIEKKIPEIKKIEKKIEEIKEIKEIKEIEEIEKIAAIKEIEEEIEKLIKEIEKVEEKEIEEIEKIEKKIEEIAELIYNTDFLKGRLGSLKDIIDTIKQIINQTKYTNNSLERPEQNFKQLIESLREYLEIMNNKEYQNNIIGQIIKSGLVNEYHSLFKEKINNLSIKELSICEKLLLLREIIEGMKQKKNLEYKNGEIILQQDNNLQPFINHVFNKLIKNNIIEINKENLKKVLTRDGYFPEQEIEEEQKKIEEVAKLIFDICLLRGILDMNHNSQIIFGIILTFKEINDLLEKPEEQNLKEFLNDLTKCLKIINKEEYQNTILEQVNNFFFKQKPVTWAKGSIMITASDKNLSDKRMILEVIRLIIERIKNISNNPYLKYDNEKEEITLKDMYIFKQGEYKKIKPLINDVFDAFRYDFKRIKETKEELKKTEEELKKLCCK